MKAHAAGALTEAAKPKEEKHKGKSHVHRMEIRRGHPKGYIATHPEHRFDDGARDHDRDASEGAQEHILPDQESLQQHVGEHMGEGAAPEGEAGGEGEGEGPEAGG